MTTIALDADAIAADSQLTLDESYRASARETKILKKGRKIYACAGTPIISELIDWHEGKIKNDDLPACAWELLVYTGKEWRSYDSDFLSGIVAHPPYAIGSGAKFALGAMLAGATAVQAVNIASQLDIYTSGPIDEIKYGKKK